MKKRFVFVFIFFIFLQLEAQSTSLIGTAAANEYSFSICADNAGNVYFGATNNNEPWIFKRDVNNNIVWSQKLNTVAVGFSSDVSCLDIIGDTIFGCGWLKTGSSIQGALLFKLNASTGSIYWVRSEATSKTYLSAMKYANGRYFACGSQTNNANGYNGKVIAVSSVTGSTIWQTPSIGLTFPGYGIDYLDDFTAASEMVNGKMFITGRSYVNANATNMRTLLIGVSDQGNIFLTKYLEFNPATTPAARFYGACIEYDGIDSLIVLQHGDDVCMSNTCTDFKVSLVKTDLLGNVSWCKEYNVATVSTELGRGLSVIANSYVFHGFANYNLNNSKIFAIKTNKQGVPEISKLISFGTGNIGHNIGPLTTTGASDYKNAKHYIPGSFFTTNTNSRDIVQLVLNDSLLDPLGCFTIAPVNVTVTAFPPYSNVLNTVLPPDQVLFGLNPTPALLSYVSPCNTVISFSQNSTCTFSVITASASSIANPTFVWSNGTVGNTITATNNDTLFVSVLNPLTCCIVVDTIIPVFIASNLTVQLPNDTTICLGPTNSFTIAPTVTPNTAPLTYLWNNQSVNSSLNITQSGTYWVGVFDGCQTVSDTIVVTVQSIPAPIITPTGPTTLCLGSSVTLSSNYPAGNLWSTGETTSSIVVSSASTITLTIQIGQCTSPSSSIQITILNLPPPSVTLSGGGNFCQGQQLDPVVVNLTGTAPWTLNYMINGQVQAPVTTTSNPYTLGQVPGTYQITSLLDSNCSSSNPVSIQLLVNPIPTIDVVPITICEGASGTLNSIVDLPGGTYLWTPTSVTTATINVAPITSTAYTVVYTLNACSISDTVLVSVNPLPSVSFVADTLVGCVPLSVNFTSTSNGDPNSCSWTLSNGQTLTGCNPSFVFNQPGCYDVTLTTTLNGCSSSTTSAQYICIENNPFTLFSVNPSTISQDNATVQFFNMSTGATSYAWDFDDNTTSSLFNPTHTFAANGSSYDVTLVSTSSFGCTSSYSLTIGYEEGLIYYVPNSFTPDGDQFNQVFLPIFSLGIDQSSYQLSIYNRWGELIFESNDLQVGWDGTYPYDNGVVQDGIYTWRIEFKLKNNDERMVLTGHLNVLR